MTDGPVASEAGRTAAASAVDDGWAARLDRPAVLLRIEPPRGRRLGVPAILAGPALLTAVAALVHLLPGLARLLEYDRVAVLRGELWRLLTGHWVHATLDHLAWDAVAFAALGGAVVVRSRRLFWRTVLGSAAAIPTVLLLLAPHWQTYRGLSGIDSALFVALAATVWIDGDRRPDRWLGVVALALFAGKVGFEILTGSAVFATRAPGYAVVPLAHLVGACAGLAALLIERRRRSRADGSTWLPP